MASRSERYEGILATWNDARGFGFISPDGGGSQVFVHVRAFPQGSMVPAVGEKLSYEVELNAEGKTRARFVRVVGTKDLPRYGRSTSSFVSYLAIVAFVVLYFVVALVWHPPVWIAAIYIGTSLVCVVIYAIDKSAAIEGRWRVSESALLLLGLFGGWPGAIVAQQLLRHKTKKRSFQAVFAATIVVNVLAFVVLASPAFAALVA